MSGHRFILHICRVEGKSVFPRRGVHVGGKNVIFRDKKLDSPLSLLYSACPFPDILSTTIPSIMRSVTVRKGEPIDRALKRLKTKLDTEGILEEMRRRRAFETPMDEKRRKARSANKRNKVKWRFTNKEEIPAAAVAPAAAEA